MRHDGIPRSLDDWINNFERRIAQLERSRTFVVANGTRKLTVSDTAPSSPGTNDLWVDTTTPALKFWSGSAWVSV